MISERLESILALPRYLVTCSLLFPPCARSSHRLVVLLWPSWTPAPVPSPSFASPTVPPDQPFPPSLPILASPTRQPTIAILIFHVGTRADSKSVLKNVWTYSR